jgi:poly(3-hydroxybutyrate) depolymerase
MIGFRAFGDKPVGNSQTAKFGPYDLGRTTVYAATQDPRFSYCLYVPPEFQASRVPPELVVVMHGSARTFTDFRDQFGDFGAAHNVLILCPLFPVSVRGDGNADGYKYISESGIRYDEVLVSIVDEVSDRYGVAFNRFSMFGFSGGAQFTNRFLLLRPERLWAASLCAPGSVTLLSDKDDWWVGTRDLESRFGRALNNNALSRVPVQMLVGSADLDTGEITHRVGGRYWMPGANKAGRSRPERLETLRASLVEAGIHVTHEVLDGVGHDPVPMIGRAKQFLALQLAQIRAHAASSSESASHPTLG